MTHEWDRKPIILMVDDTPANLGVLSEFLGDDGYEVLVAEDGESAIGRACYAKPDLILLDVVMPDIDGFDTCRRLKEHQETKDIPIIFMTALSDTENKVKGFELGAVDYITKPFQQEEARARVSLHLNLLHTKRMLQRQNQELQEEMDAHTRTQAKVQYLDAELKSAQDFGDIIGQSTSLRVVLEQVSQMAETDCTGLIIGETGTGKELIARAIHDRSPRKSKPLIKVNCAAIPKDLFESEFFGHEKGSFTGAANRRIGRFELANEGTLFLDEAGELPLDIQAKLLRVLQEQEFERVGGQTTQKVDVRIIAATNRNLGERVANKEFREDLYYRLNVFPLQIPALRERQDDIGILAQHFVLKYARKYGKPLKRITEGALKGLSGYTWPGNIRELENVIERAVILSRGIELELGAWLPQSRVGESSSDDASSMSTSASANQTLEEMERAHIQHVLEQTNWRVSGDGGAAKILGLNRTTLEARMKKLGISRKT
ncbi:MAG: sigma-54-dependent transcriptional regulator [Nitrospirales bacterium]